MRFLKKIILALVFILIGVGISVGGYFIYESTNPETPVIKENVIEELNKQIADLEKLLDEQGLELCNMQEENNSLICERDKLLEINSQDKESLETINEQLKEIEAKRLALSTQIVENQIVIEDLRSELDNRIEKININISGLPFREEFDILSFDKGAFIYSKKLSEKLNGLYYYNYETQSMIKVLDEAYNSEILQTSLGYIISPYNNQGNGTNLYYYEHGGNTGVQILDNGSYHSLNMLGNKENKFYIGFNNPYFNGVVMFDEGMKTASKIDANITNSKNGIEIEDGLLIQAQKISTSSKKALYHIDTATNQLSEILQLDGEMDVYTKLDDKILVSSTYIAGLYLYNPNTKFLSKISDTFKGKVNSYSVSGGYLLTNVGTYTNGIFFLDSTTFAIEQIYTKSTNWVNCYNLSDGVLLSSSTYGQGILFYDFSTGEVSLIKETGSKYTFYEVDGNVFAVCNVKNSFNHEFKQMFLFDKENKYFEIHHVIV